MLLMGFCVVRPFWPLERNAKKKTQLKSDKQCSAEVAIAAIFVMTNVEIDKSNCRVLFS